MPYFLLMAALIEPAQDLDSDSALLKSAGLRTDALSLLALFHERTRTDFPDIKKLIRRLGAETFAERENAAKELTSIGRTAFPLLREALKDDDKEVVRRAKICIRDIEQKDWARTPAVYAAAARRLVQLKPEGAVAALLAFLPHAFWGEEEDEAWRALEALAGKPGDLHPLLADALKDEVASRRALAACLAARLGSAKLKEEVRKLLADPDPLVRLRAAQGFLTAGDSFGIPALIALLETAPIDVAWQAEELLHWLAEWEAPHSVLGAGAAENRHRCVVACRQWFEDHEAKLDIGRLLKEPRRPALYMVQEVAAQGPRDSLQTTDPSLILIGCDSVPRWRKEFTSGSYRDFQWLPNGHTLHIRHIGDSAFETDLLGNVVWKFEEPRLKARTCRHLANGNTFITTATGMTEVAVDGTVVFSHQKGDLEYGDEREAVDRFPNGNLLYKRYHKDSWLAVSPSDNKIVREVFLEPCKYNRHVYSQFDGDEIFPFHLDGENYAVFNSLTRALDVTGSSGKSLRGNVLDGGWVYDIVRPQPGRLGIAGFVRYRGHRLIEQDDAGRVRWEVFTENVPELLRPGLRLVGFGFPEPDFTKGDVRTGERRLPGLRSRMSCVRRETAFLFQQMQEKALPAVPELVGLLADPADDVQAAAQKALVWVGPAVAPSLMSELADADPDVRTRTQIVLSELNLRPTRSAGVGYLNQTGSE